MKKFLDDDFLLETKTAQHLYHDYAKDLPIIDYHCHLPPQDIADDRSFHNITQAWLEGDHYKWRAMRTNGVNEKYITGSASDEEKFQQWAKTVPYTLRNPLYHWTHLELKRYFGIDQLLNGTSAGDIYRETSNQLQNNGLSCRGMMQKMGVEVVCTTDDPIDDLQLHQKIREDGFKIKVIPAFRPDKAYAIEDPQVYKTYLQSLSEVAGVDIKNYDTLIDALRKRIVYFHERDCRLSDHGLEHLYYVEPSAGEEDRIFQNILRGDRPDEMDIAKFKTAILLELARMYHEFGWTQQYHLGALRNNNRRMMRTLGPDTGFDSIGDFSQAAPLARFLDALDTTDQLTQTILYNLNPGDNELMATMVGNFNDGSVPGKIQFGSGWWFLDQKDGMIRQMNALSNMGLLSRFVGMLTDSRSFLSYPRHEYFRRLLCNLLGTDVERGELPNDIDLLGGMVKDICYNNANTYFKF